MESATSGLLLAQAASPDMFAQLVPFALILAVFYFLLIRPQQQKAREHDDLVKGLKRGELVVTSSGLYGKIVDLKDHEVTLEIAPNVRVRHERAKIAGSASGGAAKAGQGD
jgi:preprotein translocase subunit YajC